MQALAAWNGQYLEVLLLLWSEQNHFSPLSTSGFRVFKVHYP